MPLHWQIFTLPFLGSLPKEPVLHFKAPVSFSSCVHTAASGLPYLKMPDMQSQTSPSWAQLFHSSPFCISVSAFWTADRGVRDNHSRNSSRKRTSSREAPTLTQSSRSRRSTSISRDDLSNCPSSEGKAASWAARFGFATRSGGFSTSATASSPFNSNSGFAVGKRKVAPRSPTICEGVTAWYSEVTMKPTIRNTVHVAKRLTQTFAKKQRFRRRIPTGFSLSSESNMAPQY
mmetsp:Transcript_70532/g.168953  ORF Transcript_70532/g.168953 Transcript_70532/m.168953 type:complete len:232 (-) Transcript_70532:97-792(-)